MIFRTQSREQDVFAIAIENYAPKNQDKGIAFRKGDRFKVKSEANASSWLVSRVDKRARFYAPSNFLAKEGDLEHFEWISFDVTREEAEKRLMDTKYPPGAFIIRPRPTESISHLIALSVKVQKSINPTSLGVVRFLIKRENGAFRIDTGRQTFETLTQLVENYADRRNTSNISLTFSVKKNEFVTQWNYDEADIEKEIPLDKGDFGEVFLGKLFDKEVVAIKTPNLMRTELEDFMKEAEISRPCKHPNVLETFGICREKMYIITEYLPNGDLKKYLRKHKLSAAECLSVVQKIACAMEYLASMKIVHRDLAARNVLVGETIDTIKVCLDQLLISDSLAVSKICYYITSTETFPLGWTAPEGFVIYKGIVNTKMGQITSAADVWSFGIVVWEVYTNGQDPYSDVAATELYSKLKDDNYRLTRPAKCSEAIYAKMLECWNIDRKARPTFTDIRAFLLEQKSNYDEVEDVNGAQGLVHSDTDEDVVETEIDTKNYCVESLR